MIVQSFHDDRLISNYFIVFRVISGFDFAGPLVMPATYDYLQFAVPGAALTISWNNFSQTTWPTELNQLSKCAYITCFFASCLICSYELRDSIASIDFSANRFTGEAPDWWSVGVGGTALVSIDLSYNEVCCFVSKECVRLIASIVYVASWSVDHPDNDLPLWKPSHIEATW